MWVPFILFISLFLSVWSPVIANGFLDWDDAEAIVQNPHLSFSLANLKWMWTTFHMGPYQPLAWMSLAIDRTIWGLSPAGFHATALLWHLAASLLLFSCLQKLYPKAATWAVTAAALFWAIHPLRVESVAWATERRDVLSGFFTLLAWRLYLSERGEAGVAYLAGLLSKATAVGTIWLFMLGAKARLGKNWLRQHAGYLILGAGLCVWGAWGLRQSGVFFRAYTLGDRLGLFFYGVTHYLGKAVMPADLSPLYAMPLDLTEMKWEWVSRGLFVVSFTLITLALRRRYGLLERVWWAYLLILLPVSGIAQHGRQLAADRYTYLSFIPWSVLALDLLTRAQVSKAKVFAGLILLGLGIQTVRYVNVWKNDQTLWERATQVEPGSPLAHYNLGTAYLKAGQAFAAHRELTTAFQMWPQDEGFRTNLITAGMASADASIRAGRPANAVFFAEEAWRLRPESPGLRFNLGAYLMAAGRSREGQAHLRAAIRQDPSLAARLPPGER